MKYYLIIENKKETFVEGTYTTKEEALKRKEAEMDYIKRDKRSGERAFVVESDAFDSGNYDEIEE